MTTRTTITMQEADEIIQNSKYDLLLDGEFEIHDLGYIYGLETGGAVVVTFSGKMIESEKLDAALSMLNTSEHFEDWDGTVDLSDDGIVFGMNDGSEVLALDVLCRYEKN